MVVIEGVARELADKANIWELARPLVTEWVSKHLGPAGQLQRGAAQARQGIEGWLRLPARIEQVLSDRDGSVFTPQFHGAPLWQRACGMVLLSGGIVMLQQQAQGPWWMPVGVLGVVLGAALLLRR